MRRQVAKATAPVYAAVADDTLIELQEYQGNQQTPLWRKLWINVMPQDEADLPLPKN